MLGIYTTRVYRRCTYHGVYLSIPPWVYHGVHPTHRWSTVYGWGALITRRRGPGLNIENNMVNVREEGLPEPKGVRVGRVGCAEFFRFSRENKVEDWIDEG